MFRVVAVARGRSANHEIARSHITISQIATSQMARPREGIPAGVGTRRESRPSGREWGREWNLVPAVQDHQITKSPNRQMTWLFAVDRAATGMSCYAGPLPCGRGSAGEGIASRDRLADARGSD